jgi:ABC-2 type transport system ATP-binding protein
MITLFMTTHYMDEAEYCDRIAIIDSGKIVALDTPEMLKEGVGGDMLDLKTDNDAQTEQELKAKYGIIAQRDEQGLCFEVKNGAGEIPVLVRELSAKVLSVSVRRPTLDDVFLKLTGREIRDDGASNRDKLKGFVRRTHRT